MNRELRDKWVAELRSGRYIQGSGALRAPSKEGTDRFCCLGVLCDIVAPEKWSDRPLVNCGDVEGAYKHDHSAGLPSLDFLRHLNLDVEHSYDLSQQNDNGATFHAIADYIEEML